jgi:hypothetical protein
MSRAPTTAEVREAVSQARSATRRIYRTPLVLIGCSARKLDRPAPARDLYLGDLFRKSVTWAEGRGYPWLVLSALHGAVLPDDVIAPYDVTLNALDTEDRKLWATSTFLQLRRKCGLDRPIIILAGEPYRRHLVPRLRGETTFSISTPLGNLGIGKQRAALALSIATGEPL